MKSLSIQLKQFLLSTAFAFVAIAGISISKSFDNDYLMQAQLKTNKIEKVKKVAKTENSSLEKGLSTVSFKIIK